MPDFDLEAEAKKLQETQAERREQLIRELLSQPPAGHGPRPDSHSHRKVA